VIIDSKQIFKENSFNGVKVFKYLQNLIGNGYLLNNSKQFKARMLANCLRQLSMVNLLMINQHQFRHTGFEPNWEIRISLSLIVLKDSQNTCLGRILITYYNIL